MNAELDAQNLPPISAENGGVTIATPFEAILHTQQDELFRLGLNLYNRPLAPLNDQLRKFDNNFYINHKIPTIVRLAVNELQSNFDNPKFRNETLIVLSDNLSSIGKPLLTAENFKDYNFLS